jgi:hypothetical protein
MKKASNNDDESRVVTGVAWYRPKQWQRLREVAEDIENLEESYEAWLQTAERLIREGIPSNLSAEKVDVDIEALLAWCNARGLAINAKTRSHYVSEKLREKYEAS